MNSNFLERTRNISKNYFLNVDISLTMHDPGLKLHICIQNIVMEGTMSQIFFITASSFFMKF